MALVLDATIGGVAANSYLTQADAIALVDGIPNALAWINADATAGGAREQALVYATTLLDALRVQGVKTTFSQALLWPRGGVLDPDYGSGSDAFTGYVINMGGEFGQYLSMTDIPARVKKACVMLALEILRAGTADVWGIDTTVNVAKKSIGSGAIGTDYIDIRMRRLGLRAFPNVWRNIGPLTLSARPQTVERG